MTCCCPLGPHSPSWLSTHSDAPTPLTSPPAPAQPHLLPASPKTPWRDRKVPPPCNSDHHVPHPHRAGGPCPEQCRTSLEGSPWKGGKLSVEGGVEKEGQGVRLQSSTARLPMSLCSPGLGTWKEFLPDPSQTCPQVWDMAQHQQMWTGWFWAKGPMFGESVCLWHSGGISLALEHIVLQTFKGTF